MQPPLSPNAHAPGPAARTARRRALSLPAPVAALAFTGRAFTGRAFTGLAFTGLVFTALAFTALAIAAPGARAAGVTSMGAMPMGATSMGARAAGAPPGVVVHRPWLRSIIPSRPVAGYFTLSNDSDTALQLVGASSPGCGTLMLHRSMNMGGQETMAMVRSVRLPAHGKLVFAPGGYHLMCLQPTAAVQPGGAVAVTLRFSNGDAMTATFPVRNATGR